MISLLCGAADASTAPGVLRVELDCRCFKEIADDAEVWTTGLDDSASMIESGWIINNPNVTQNIKRLPHTMRLSRSILDVIHPLPITPTTNSFNGIVRFYLKLL